MPKQTVFQHLRDICHWKAGLIEPQPHGQQTKSIKVLEENWSPTFERLMRNRLMVGALRYGLISQQKKKRKTGVAWDVLKPIQDKVAAYERTGNTEYLVDAANYLLLVFELDEHPNKHFSTLDDHHDHCELK